MNLESAGGWEARASRVPTRFSWLRPPVPRRPVNYLRRWFVRDGERDVSRVSHAISWGASQVLWVTVEAECLPHPRPDLDHAARAAREVAWVVWMEAVSTGSGQDPCGL